MVNYLGPRLTYVYLYMPVGLLDITNSCAKTAEPTETPFGCGHGWAQGTVYLARGPDQSWFIPLVRVYTFKKLLNR